MSLKKEKPKIQPSTPVRRSPNSEEATASNTGRCWFESSPAHRSAAPLVTR